MHFRLNPASDALFLDIDGTILDIAPDARSVHVPPDLLEDLARLDQKLDGALAFISGRTLENVDALFQPLQLSAAGVHGAEWRLKGLNVEAHSPPLPKALVTKIFDVFKDWPKVEVEDKIRSVAIHYRKAPKKAAAVAKRLAGIVEAETYDLKTIKGRKVYEVTLRGFDKGQAVGRFLAQAPFQGRRPFFLGDDTTDLAAIGYCNDIGGVGVRVGRDCGGSASAFSCPAKVRSWLKKQAQLLEV